MPVVSAPADIREVTSRQRPTSSVSPIFNTDFLHRPHHQAPAPESSASPIIKNSIIVNANIDSLLNTDIDLRKGTDPIKQRGQAVIVAEVAIIIDDIGYNRSQGLAAINISGNLTYAIIPHSPYAKFLATTAHQQQKEVILHAPMSNIHDHPMGKSGLTEDMDEAAFDHTLLNAMASVPHIKGVNNHMGSLLTQMQRPMNWTMRTLKANGLFLSTVGQRQLVSLGKRHKNTASLLLNAMFFSIISATAYLWQSSLSALLTSLRAMDMLSLSPIRTQKPYNT